MRRTVLWLVLVWLNRTCNESKIRLMLSLRQASSVKASSDAVKTKDVSDMSSIVLVAARNTASKSFNPFAQGSQPGSNVGIDNPLDRLLPFLIVNPSTVLSMAKSWAWTSFPQRAVCCDDTDFQTSAKELPSD